MRTLILVLAATTLTAATAQTQQRTKEQVEASLREHQGDFDYLLGDWSFNARSKQWGDYHGVWSAVRLPEGAMILDEFRVLGDSGQTWHLSHTLRTYNAVLDQWELVTADGTGGLMNSGIAHKVGNEIHIEQRFGVKTPEEGIWRIRYYNIRPDGFSWAADRSTDEGKTWVENWLTIETRRTGPARNMAPLAVAR
jgi:hypothetical protein